MFIVVLICLECCEYFICSAFPLISLFADNFTKLNEVSLFLWYKFGTEQKKLHFLPFGILIDNLKFNLQVGSCKQNGSFVKGHAANHHLCYRMQTVLHLSTKMQSFSSQWINFLFDATVDVTEIIRETTKQILTKLLCITCFIKIYTMFLLAFRI